MLPGQARKSSFAVNSNAVSVVVCPFSCVAGSGALYEARTAQDESSRDGSIVQNSTNESLESSPAAGLVRL